jgi:hypothetical protein
VRLTATGGWGQWPLRGVVVVAGRSSPSHLPELLGLSAAAATVLFAWFWVGRRRASDLAPAAPVGPAGFLPGGAPLRATARPHGTAWTEVALYLLPFLLVALLFISHSAILDLAAVAALGLVFLVRPELALPIAAASVASWQRPETILRWQFSLLEMTTWLGALALAARLLLDRAGLLAYTRWQGAKGIRGLDWPVLALLGSGLMAALFARFQDYAWGEFRTVFLAGTLLYWLASRAGWSDRRHWPVLHGLVAGLTAASAIALWQLASGEGRIAVEGVWRVSALYGSPNNLALVLDRGVPLAVAIAAFGLGRKRWVYAAAALIMVAAALATLSKGALLVGLPVGLATTLGIGAWRARVRWPWFALAAMLSGAILGWLALRNTPRFGGLLDTTTGTTFLRLKLWRGAVNMALDHPLLGVGPDNFLYQYRSRYVQPSAWQELNLSHPHNIILDLWTRLGIPGLLAGAWAFGAAGITGWRITKAAARDVWPPALGLLAGLAGTVAHGLIDNAIFLPDLMAIFMITLALYRRWQVGILTEETA